MDNPAEICAKKKVSVTMLGGFTLQGEEDLLTDEINRSQKLWNVLCYLLAHRDRNVSQTEFIDLFWPEDNSTNPVNALKTLLYRVRAMLEPMFPADVEPILSQRGSYSWNRSILCEVDAEVFEQLCREAARPDLPPPARMTCYEQALALYRGDYLPKLASQLWVVPLSAHYHTLYLDAVKAYAALLEQGEQFGAVAEICTRANQLDPLDEDIYVLLIRALLRQGKEGAALTQYEHATETLYRSLGVRPSEELRDLYVEIMRVEKKMETDLEVIQHNLKEAAARPGAFFCEYGFFKEAYRLEVRRTTRNGTCVHIALITVALPGGGLPQLPVLNTTMDQLLDVLITNLRRGDVVARYSGAQYVVMLPSANFEDSTMIMDRIVSVFYRQHRRNFLKLSYKIRALDQA